MRKLQQTAGHVGYGNHGNWIVLASYIHVEYLALIHFSREYICVWAPTVCVFCYPFSLLLFFSPLIPICSANILTCSIVLFLYEIIPKIK